MPRGPQHQKLADYVHSADPDSLDLAATQWRTGMNLLRQVSRELNAKSSGMRLAESSTDGSVWSGATASTARDAFSKSSVAMHDKSNEMQAGSDAFTDAATGIRNARQALHQLDSRDPGSFPSAPPVTPGPSTKADEKAKSDYTTAVNGWWADYNANERVATTAITDLEHNHTTQAKVFQRIHGEPPPNDEPPVNTNGNPVKTGTPVTTTHVPTTGLTSNDNDNDNDNHPTTTTPTTPTTTTTTTPTTPTGTTVGPGIPQGPGHSQTTSLPTGPGLPGTIAGGGTVGGGAGAMGGVGAVAGGALGGAAAAGLAAGGLNGGLNGLVPAGGVRGGLSAAGVRGIGATSRTGAGSVLGRGTSGSGRAGAGGMSSRSGGRNGGRNSGRSAGTRGARGQAGGRGAGAGAGSGRNGKDKKRQGEERDLFDDGNDWIDDEDVAPGLLD
jgi:hypothetical protein